MTGSAIPNSISERSTLCNGFVQKPQPLMIIWGMAKVAYATFCHLLVANGTARATEYITLYSLELSNQFWGQ